MTYLLLVANWRIYHLYLWLFGADLLVLCALAWVDKCCCEKGVSL